MTYSLPFGLTQKPMAHYITNGVIKFSCREGKLFYVWVWISKGSRGTIRQGEVKSKDQLKGLLSIKYVDEQPLLEVIN